MAESTPPRPGVYAPLSFVCGSGGCITTFTQRPVQQVASVLLEDVTDWSNALRGLPANTEIPPGVAAAVNQLHDAVANWSELIGRNRRA